MLVMKTQRRLGSFALDLAVSRSCVAVDKARRQVVLDQEDLEAVEILRDELQHHAQRRNDFKILAQFIPDRKKRALIIWGMHRMGREDRQRRLILPRAEAKKFGEFLGKVHDGGAISTEDAVTYFKFLYTNRIDALAADDVGFGRHGLIAAA